MAEHMVADADELVTCPYDRVHRVKAGRIRIHIMKCRRNYTAAHFDTSQCRYNASHIIPTPEIKWHEQNCPDKVSVDSLIYSKTEAAAAAVPLQNHEVTSSEDWDEETKDLENLVGFDMQLVVMNTPGAQYQADTSFLKRKEKIAYRDRLLEQSYMEKDGKTMSVDQRPIIPEIHAVQPPFTSCKPKQPTHTKKPIVQRAPNISSSKSANLPPVLQKNLKNGQPKTLLTGVGRGRKPVASGPISAASVRQFEDSNEDDSFDKSPNQPADYRPKARLAANFSGQSSNTEGEGYRSYSAVAGSDNTDPFVMSGKGRGRGRGICQFWQ